jgi:hypothetical protein
MLLSRATLNTSSLGCTANDTSQSEVRDRKSSLALCRWTRVLVRLIRHYFRAMGHLLIHSVLSDMNATCRSSLVGPSLFHSRRIIFAIAQPSSYLERLITLLRSWHTALQAPFLHITLGVFSSW